MAKVYIVNGEPHEVSEENEEKFLQKYKDDSPTLDPLMTSSLGNQNSSTEGASVEQILQAPISNVENGDSQSQLEENQSSSVSTSTNQNINKGSEDPNDVSYGKTWTQTGNDVGAGEVWEWVDNSKVEEINKEINKNQGALDNIQQAKDQRNIDTDGDGVTDLAESSVNRANDFYNDTTYNNSEQLEIDQKKANAKWEADQKQREEYVKKINERMSYKDRTSLPYQPLPNVTREIDQTAQGSYDEAIRDVSVQDFIVAMGANFEPTQKEIQSLYEKDKDGNFINPIYEKIYNKNLEEANYNKQNRAELNKKLRNKEITKEEYDESLKKLDGYKDQDGNVIEGEDRFHNTFQNNLTRADKQASLTEEINNVLEEGRGEGVLGIGSDQKKYKKEQEEIANALLTNTNNQIQETQNKVVATNIKREEIYNTIKTDSDWFESEEENGGKWTIAEIEKIKKQKITGNESIVNKITELSETEIKGDPSILENIEKISNGKYTTQEQVDEANAKIEALSKEYEASAQPEVDRINNEIIALQKQYENEINSKVNDANRRIKELALTYNGKYNLIKDNQKLYDDYTSLEQDYRDELVGLGNNASDLSIYSSESRKRLKATNVLNMAGAMTDFAVNIVDMVDLAFEAKDNVLDKIPNQNLRKVIDVMSYMLPVVGTSQIVGDLLFQDRVDDDKFKGEKQSLWDVGSDFYKEQKHAIIGSKIVDPPKFEDLVIDGKPQWNAIGEYSLSQAVSQIPIVTALVATAPAGPLAGLAVISASSIGAKYDELNEGNDLYRKSGGIYGNNYSFGEIALNSSIHGIVEGALEYTTGGILGKTIGTLSKSALKKQAKLGFASYLRKNVITPKNAAYSFGESLEESFTEGATAVAQNINDIFVLGRTEVGVWDNVLEGAVNGFGMGAMFQSPRLGQLARRPFTTGDQNQQLGNIANKSKEIAGEITRLRNTNDPANLKKIERLEKQYVALNVQSDQILQETVKRVDVLTDSQKAELIDIERANLQDRVEAEKIASNTKLTEQDRANQLKALKANVDNRNINKNKILNAVEPKVAQAIFETNQDWVQSQADLANEMGPVDVKSRDVSAKEFENINRKNTGAESKAVLENVVLESMAFKEALTNVVNDKTSTPEQVADAKRILKENSVDNNINIGEAVLTAKNNYGMMIPKITDGKLAGVDIVVNRDAALKDGELNTGAHEFVHAAFANVLKGDPVARVAMGKQIDKILSGSGVEFSDVARKKYDQKLDQYDGNVQGEEKLAFVSEMLLNGDIKFKDGPLTKIGGMLRRFAQNTIGHPIKFNSANDVKNFLRDYKQSYDTKKASPAITRMLQNGASGKIFNNPKNAKQRKDEASFSRAVNLNRRSNPDLKREFDQFVKNEDGSKKYESDAMFKDSPDFTGAYLNILEGRALDGLIQQGMTERGLPPEALREFTRSAKEEISRRFIKNFNYDKNDSLFGWLTGVSGGAGMSIIYRAKGDVMVQYKKDNKAQQTSMDKPIGESGTIADIIQDERDILIEQLENQDLSAGRKSDARQLIKENKVKDVLDFSNNTRSVIADVVNSTNVDMTNLTYKGVKDLMTNTDGKATSEKKVTPTGPLFEVLNAVSSEFGVDPLRILSNQDLNGEQRLAAQNYIFDKAINEDGSFNKSLLNTLPEGETRSGEATGVANTKLGQLYRTGPRLKVSEGALKGLGQKNAQIKRSNISSGEFLSLFGINQDGSFVKGTGSDGAIRALITQVAQTTANQEIRQDAIVNRKVGDAVIAKLKDGASEQMWSLADNVDRQGVYKDISNNVNTATEVGEIDALVENIVDIHTDAGVKGRNKGVNDFKKFLSNVIQRYIFRKNILGKNYDLTLEQDLLNRDAQETDESADMSIQKKLKLDNPPGNEMLTTEGVAAIQDNIGESLRVAYSNSGPIEAGIQYLTHGLNAFTGMGVIGDGRIVKGPDGKPMYDSKWENYVHRGKPIVKGGVTYKSGDTVPGNKWKTYDSKTIKNAPKGSKIGDLRLNNKGQKIKRDNRYKPFASVADFIEFLNNLAVKDKVTVNGEKVWIKKEKGSSKYQVWDGKQWNKVDTNMLKENSTEAIKDINNPDRQAKRKRESDSARDFSIGILQAAFNNPNVSDSTLGALLMNLGSGMDSPMRKSALLTMVVKNHKGVKNWYDKNKAKIVKKYGSSVPALRYEHSESKSVINNRILDSLMQTSKDGNTGIISDNVWDGYEVFVIPGLWDHAQNKAQLKTQSAGDGQLRATAYETIAELVDLVKDFGPSAMVNISEFTSVESKTDTLKEDKIKSSVDLARKIIKLGPVDTTQQDVVQKTGVHIRKLQDSLVMNSKALDDPKGMSIFDFDETLIVEGENVIIATNPKTKETETISSEDFPTRGTELMDQGWDMNFDDFVNVKGGVKGPLFQKLLNRIKKYGPNNNFVLTARPQESAVAIHGWLKSKGINIPLKNITGLADSKGDSKAAWVLEKYEEGYNDVYFVDDAMQNVAAVKHVMDQLDIKGSSVQAKIKVAKDINNEFNSIIEEVSDVKADKIVSSSEAKRLGSQRAKWDFFVPASAEDFRGLMYRFMGKGKKGDGHKQWFKENLFDPFAKATRDWNNYKQNMSNDYAALRKEFKDVSSTLKDNVPGTNFSNDNAIRTYLWDKAGFDIPGLPDAQKQMLVDHVKANPNMVGYAEILSRITKTNDGYIQPDENWSVKSIASDLRDTVSGIGRQEFFSEWINNKNTIFSPDNLNKLQSIHGNNFVQELKDMLYRMETGSNRPTGSSAQTNKFLNWINGSVGAVMFFNTRSAVLQTMSTVNFINWQDNNMFTAAKAFANQPQYWKDFMYIMNSPMLKQRRAGLQIDVSASELSDAFSQGRSKPEAAIRFLLEKGFLPTQIADSFAIAAGGAPFYRNRVNKYIKEGKHPEQAAQEAWMDFQEIAEETQQSSRPDMISNQQAGPLGRLILAWQNTPMQMTRLTKKALSDLVNGRGSAKANISRIMYYGLIQNIWFGTLQTGLGFLLFGGEQEEEVIDKKTQRVLNGALDTLLRGTGIYGAMASTLKNTVLKFAEQRKKGWSGDQGYTIIEAMNLSPPIGSKLRKIYSAIKTDQFDRGLGKKLGFRIENPTLSIVGNVVEALTNFPMARLVNKANNIEEALTGNHKLWQRAALLGGWNKWTVGVKDEEVEEAKAELKQDKIDQKKIDKENKKKEDNKKKEEQKIADDKIKEKDGIKTVRCSGKNSSGKQCGLTTETKKKTWKCAHHAEFVDGSDTDKDGIKEYRCTATKSNGQRCKNKTENKNKKCYAHQ